MAKRGGFGGGGGGGGGIFDDANRDGVNDNYDRKPGNDSDSPEYARRYDPRSEQEFTNLPEIANQLEERDLYNQAEKNTRQARAEMLDAQGNVHFWPNIGKFVVPAENTWAAHAELVKDDQTALHFNPGKYIFFDKVIAEKLHLPALFEANHPDYKKYEGLRTNLEVIRNDIIGQYMHDGSFDPGDEKFIPSISTIAVVLGDALANDTWLKKPFTKSISMDVANVEAVGAAEMYKYILERQDKTNFLTPLKQSMRQVLQLPRNDWELSPLADSPFSDAALAAPAPRHGAAPVISSPAARSKAIEPPVNDLAHVALGMLDKVSRLNSPHDLPPPTEKEAVEHGRVILRWLRNLELSGSNIEEWLDQGTPDMKLNKAEMLSDLVSVYASQLAKSPNPLDPKFDESSAAAGAIALTVAEIASDSLPDSDPRLADLTRMIDALPPEYSNRQSQSISQLLEVMERGITQASSVRLSDYSIEEELLLMRERIAANAKKLRSVDSLESPTREESVELARRILRKLEIIGDKSMADALDTGRPEDRMQLIAEVDEMVEIYRNLLAEAQTTNPDITKDPRIKEANDAVGGFAHAISLLAAKEIPTSVAAAQKISADVTQDPNEWKDLHDRTVGRLVKSMEGGLEKAIEEVALQQQAEQGQDEDIAAAAMEAALHQGSRRRRRRRQRSGGGAARANKTQRDITADDYVLKQGRFASDAKAARSDGGGKAFMGLNQDALDQARNIGLSMQSQASGMQNADNSPLAPDDKKIAERIIQDERNRRSNVGPKI